MRFGLLVVFALWSVGLALAEPSWLVPRNSYIVRPVASVRDLANQIRTEPVVAQRYACHFGRSAYELADYFEKNLVLAKLERAETFNVYYAPPDNRLLVVRKTLPKDTPVFVDKKTRKPVLKANCGNPLTPVVSIPHQQVQTPATPLLVSTPAPHLAQEVTLPEVPTVELVELPLEEVVAADVLPTEVIAEVMPELEPEPTEVLAEAMPAPAEPMPPVVNRAGAPWWLLIPVGGLLIRDQGDNLPPIPEPGSLMALGAGLGLLYPLSRRAFRRSQKVSQRGSASTTDSA